MRASGARRYGLAGAAAALAIVGTLAISAGRAAAASITFDTGSGLVLAVDSTNGNLTSLRHQGVELASPGQAAGQFESGWSAATVTSQTFNNGTAILISAANTGIGVTQYYFARKGDNTVYLATRIERALNPGEARFISRLSSSRLPQSPVAANTAGTTTAVEGSDVFAFPNGTTASKFYSSQRLVAQRPFGASGSGHGVFVVPGSQEMTSGGPFFRDIEVNNTGSTTNLTMYMFSGHAQTEAMRTGLHGPYALAVTDGSAAPALNFDFLSSFVPGLPSVAQRGTVTGAASGSWGATALVALSGPTGQYWAPVQNGRFTIAKVRPGTYTATLYAGELAVGNPQTVTVSAGQTATTALSGDTPASGTLFQIGAFDGTPQGLLNADRIETMHPSDVRMSNWNVGTFTVGSAPSAFPMAMFKAVNPTVTVNFPLGSVPAQGVRLRIGTTIGFAGGRPAISIGGFTSPSSASPAPVDLNSRSITRGTWRGPNRTYQFTVPAGALHSGTNSLAITVISGSSGTAYLSPSFVFDALALDPA